MLRRKTLVLLALAPLAAGAAGATTLERLSIQRMTTAAAVVARVRSVASAVRWEGGEIWTFTTFDVVEVWNGSAPPRITVRLIGGRAGELISTVQGVPRFRPGEEAVLFLEPSGASDFTVVSWVQGTFRIHRDARSGEERVTQDSAGLAAFDPSTREFRADGLRNAPLEELRARVRTALTHPAGMR